MKQRPRPQARERGNGRRRPLDARAQARWIGLLGVVLCTSAGGIIVWRGWEDAASGDFAVLFLLGLCVSGALASAGLTLNPPHAERASRVASFVGTTSVVGFFACLVVFGLVAPALVVSPGSGKAPDTVGEARMLALWTLVVVVAVAVSAVVDRRRARKALKRSTRTRSAT